MRVWFGRDHIVQASIAFTRWRWRYVKPHWRVVDDVGGYLSQQFKAGTPAGTQDGSPVMVDGVSGRTAGRWCMVSGRAPGRKCREARGTAATNTRDLHGSE